MALLIAHRKASSLCVLTLRVRKQVLKLLAEMSPFCGDMDKLEANLNMLFTKLLVRMTVARDGED